MSKPPVSTTWVIENPGEAFAYIRELEADKQIAEKQADEWAARYHRCVAREIARNTTAENTNSHE